MILTFLIALDGGFHAYARTKNLRKAPYQYVESPDTSQYIKILTRKNAAELRNYTNRYIQIIIKNIISSLSITISITFISS